MPPSRAVAPQSSMTSKTLPKGSRKYSELPRSTIILQRAPFSRRLALAMLLTLKEGVGGWAYINQDCRDVWKVFGPNAAKIVGADAFNGVTGQSNIGLTYCSGDPVGQSPYAKYVARIKAFAPESDGKFSPQSASYTYDQADRLSRYRFISSFEREHNRCLPF